MNKESVNIGLLWYYYGLMCSGRIPILPHIYHQRNANQVHPGMTKNMHYHAQKTTDTAGDPETDRGDSLSSVFDQECPAELHNAMSGDAWSSREKTEPWISFEDMGAYSAITSWPYFPWQIQRPTEKTKPSEMWSDLERHIQKRKAHDQWNSA
ncbi:hypothetical protein AALO_G00209690, partial [Alosa alosa]